MAAYAYACHAFYAMRFYAFCYAPCQPCCCIKACMHMLCCFAVTCHVAIHTHTHSIQTKTGTKCLFSRYVIMYACLRTTRHAMPCKAKSQSSSSSKEEVGVEW